MGTKRQIAEIVAALVGDCRSGPLLDMFSGMCSVGTAVAPTRPIWSNDLQVFANTVALSSFCSKSIRPSSTSIAEKSLPVLKAHIARLESYCISAVQAERAALQAADTELLQAVFISAISSSLISSYDHKPEYSLFSTLYGGSYFSYTQAIEIDGIRLSIDNLLEQHEISQEDHRWALVALCVAMAKCATTTGHFAQPLSPKHNNLQRFRAQRNRKVWQEWTQALSNISAIGGRAWRKGNKVFRHEASTALERIALAGCRPGVVYADPPYTKDQYSRYYHIYETAILYDYPTVTGKGLYRSDRSVSPFCLASKVDVAVEELIRSCASIGADLVMSYPNDGVMVDSSMRIPALMRRHFKSEAEIIQIPHHHSTLGASKGTQSNGVLEVIYRVRH